MQETIARGEHILQTMSGAPPLVYFTLGALYHKIGDHKTAVTNLAYVLENQSADEAELYLPFTGTEELCKDPAEDRERTG